MIKSLSLKNFIIVRNLELDFEDGLQVLTGETGAGKSIIVGAIDVILGGKVRSGMVFDEEKSATLEVVFSIEKANKKFLELLSKNEVDISEKEVFMAKEIYPNLRSKCFLNGRRISNPIIKEFREVLLDFHSQKDEQKLLDNSYQLEILDSFGGLVSQRKRYEEKFFEVRTKLTELQNLRKLEHERAEKVKLFQYQVDELEDLDLKEKEDENLQNELNLLTHTEEIIKQSQEIENRIFEQENSVYDTINSFIIRLGKFSEDNIHLKNTIEHLHGSLANLDEAISEIRQIKEFLDVDKSRLKEVENRLDTLNLIKNKYKMEIPEILAYLKKIKGNLDSYSEGKKKSEILGKVCSGKKDELKKSAVILSENRRKNALKFEKDIEHNIKKLAIPDAKIKIRFDKVNAQKDFTPDLEYLTRRGQDEIEFFFSANRGVKMQPLKDAASGGEFSRVLLTIKKILSAKMDKKTIIFDEIDTGIGGNTARLLGEFIANIGKFHQVICITHLPQIASYADINYAIKKRKGKKFPTIEIKKLNEKEKKEEIARMLAGNGSITALKYAEEILKKVNSA